MLFIRNSNHYLSLALFLIFRKENLKVFSILFQWEQYLFFSYSSLKFLVFTNEPWLQYALRMPSSVFPCWSHISLGNGLHSHPEIIYLIIFKNITKNSEPGQPPSVWYIPQAAAGLLLLPQHWCFRHQTFSKFKYLLIIYDGKWKKIKSLYYFYFSAKLNGSIFA